MVTVVVPVATVRALNRAGELLAPIPELGLPIHDAEAVVVGLGDDCWAHAVFMDGKVDEDAMLQPTMPMPRRAAVPCRESYPFDARHFVGARCPGPHNQHLGLCLPLRRWLDVVERATGADCSSDGVEVPGVQRNPLQIEAHMVAEVHVFSVSLEPPCPHLKLGGGDRQLPLGHGLGAVVVVDEPN